MNTKRNLLSGLASVAALVVLVVAASVPSASAIRGSDDQPRMEDSVAVASDDDPVGDAVSSKSAELEDRIKTVKDDAKSSVEKARENRKAQSAEKRQMVCEKRQTAINNKIAAFTKAANIQMTHLDKVYVKLTDYQKANNVTVDGYTDLTSAADAKKQAALDAVAALKAVATEVDCTNPDVAVTLTTVKQAAQTTRVALRDYRASLHNILVALAQASETEDDTSTSNDTTTETTDGGAQ